MKKYISVVLLGIVFAIGGTTYQQSKPIEYNCFTNGICFDQNAIPVTVGHNVICWDFNLPTGETKMCNFW